MIPRHFKFQHTSADQSGTCEWLAKNWYELRWDEPEGCGSAGVDHHTVSEKDIVGYLGYFDWQITEVIEPYPESELPVEELNLEKFGFTFVKKATRPIRSQRSRG